MRKRSKLGCFGKLFVFTTLIVLILAFFGLVRLEYFHIRGQVLETTDPNIDYVYTNLGTNEYGQPEENFEIINKKYKPDNIVYMFTIGKYPAPGNTVNYSRLKIFIKWPIYKILWLNFVR